MSNFLTRWIFGSGRKAEEERPPEPAPETEQRDRSLELSEVEVPYQSGGSETFEAVEVYYGDRYLTVQPPEFVISRYNYPVAAEGQKVKIPYETLARRPVREVAGIVTVEYEYTPAYEWSSRNQEWVQRGGNVEITDVVFDHGA